MKTFLSIQYLRGLAAFLVVCVHVNSTALLSFGGSGVDIFFVISGFIMWTITAARESSPRTFATRRLLRIVPLYWAFTLLLPGASLLVPAAFPNFRFSVGELVASLAFFPVYNTTNGFARPVLQQGWSLNCEMLFYVIMAAALLFGRGVRALIVVGTLLALVAAGQLLPAGIAAVEIWATPLLLEFVAGIAIAALVAANRLPNPVLATACIFASLVGYLVAFLYSGPEGPPLRVVAWGVPSALLVLAMLTLEQRTRFLQNRLLQLIGDASYSIYLTHSFAISLVHKAMSMAHLDPALRDSWTAMSAKAVASVAGGIVVYWLIEKPLTRLAFGWRRAPSVDSKRAAPGTVRTRAAVRAAT